MAGSRPTHRVWDPFVRGGHWALAAAVALAWFTRTGAGRWHEWTGYVALVLVGLRIAWGWCGPRYARFSQFVRSPAATLRYAAQLAAGRQPRYAGHNPLGGWMVLALLATTALAALSGWLYTTNAYWGEQWLEAMHYGFAVALLVLVALHVAGVAATSLSHRENLLTAMIHGRKRQPRGDDVT